VATTVEGNWPTLSPRQTYKLEQLSVQKTDEVLSAEMSPSVYGTTWAAALMKAFADRAMETLQLTFLIYISILSVICVSLFGSLEKLNKTSISILFLYFLV
jgi:hypothetical protein